MPRPFTRIANLSPKKRVSVIIESYLHSTNAVTICFTTRAVKEKRKEDNPECRDREGHADEP